MWQRLPSVEMTWMPSIEMFEKEERFIVRAELPGVKEEDTEVSISGDILTIRGERKFETEVKEEDYYLCESSYGSFSRSINMPAGIDASKVDASFGDGILEVNLPKAKEAKPEKIKIKPKAEKTIKTQKKSTAVKTTPKKGKAKKSA
jgi:HSP20 family protein